MERTQRIFGHLQKGAGDVSSFGLTTEPVSGRFADSPDDVVIIQALRTPLCKANRGGLKDTYLEDMLACVFSGIIKDTGIEPSTLEDICIGNVLAPGSAAMAARIGQFYSNIPTEVPLHTVNRQCSSGLQACANIAASIKAGNIDIGMAGGVESISFTPMNKPAPGLHINPKIGDHDAARNILIPMGMTSENVAARYGVSREKQDQMAFDSHRKATAAQKNGYFDAEIVPITTTVTDKEGNTKEVTLTKDDGVRPSTTLEGLAKLKPVFMQGGTTTAGNSSQTTDGAAAVIMARRSYAQQHGLPIRGVFRAFSVAGVPPDVMGIGPAVAIPMVLNKAGLSVADIDVFELNEAFASQAVYCVEKCGIPMEKVNPNGGAIALGHPLGCTGARQVATLLHELHRRAKPALGVVSMCIGTGMGAAAVIEYPGA